jgi:hypothetical protein
MAGSAGPSHWPLVPFPRTRWIDLARAKPPAGHRRIFIERVYAALARLPRPLLIGFAAAGHPFIEARHLRGIQRRITDRSNTGVRVREWRKLLLTRCLRRVTTMYFP